MRPFDRLAGALTALVLLFLWLPIGILVAYSFNASRLNVLWEGFTWRWYGALASDAALVRALGSSLWVALWTTLLSVVLGASGACLLARYRYRGARLVQTLVLVPMIAPEVILGVSLLALFVAVRLELGYATIVASHVTFCLPFVMVAVAARLAELDPALEEAAVDLGATPIQAYRRVILPSLTPAIVAGALLAFTLSLDELIVTWFTASAATRTLPLEIYGRVRKGLDPSLNAISTVLLLGTIAFVALGEWLRRGARLLERGRPAHLGRLARRRAGARAGTRGTVSRGALLFVGVGAAGLAGCTPREPSRELDLFAWSEYVPASVIEGFTRETGIRVNYETYASNEELLTKLVSGATRYDLIQPSEYAVEALIKAGRLAPIDWARVPNARHLAPEWKNLPHDPEQRYSVPWMGGTVGIVVNTDRVRAEEVRGYRDVFQEKHRGRIVVVDDPHEMVGWAFATLGIGANDVRPANLERARPVLERWLPLVKVFDSDSPKTALLNGDVDLGIVWSGEAALLYRENAKFRYVLPVEGAHRFVDSLVVPADAPNRDAAHAFMDYVLRPEVSRQISAEFPYTNPNLAARALLTPAELANPASYPTGTAQLETFRDIGEAAVEIDRLVTDVKARS